MAINVGTKKRGDTIAFYFDLRNDDETPATGLVEYLTSQIRNQMGKLLATFNIVELEDTPGRYLLFTSERALSQNWLFDKIQFDIQYDDGRTVSSSDTFEITIVPDVTRDET